jgi:hypothetical protein
MDSSGKGVHKFHFGNVAVFDFVLTIIGAGIISYFTEIPISITIILSLLLAIFVHWLFGIQTSVNKFLRIN